MIFLIVLRYVSYFAAIYITATVSYRLGYVKGARYVLEQWKQHNRGDDV